MSEWTPKQSADLYRIADWGEGFFSVSPEGNLRVHPRGAATGMNSERSVSTRSIDLPNLVGELERRGLRRPMLIRFSDVLDARIEHLAGCFSEAISENEYGGRWRGVYPIKVNQQAHVVEEVVGFGARFGVGLEAKKSIGIAFNEADAIAAVKQIE